MLGVPVLSLRPVTSIVAAARFRYHRKYFHFNPTKVLHKLGIKRRLRTEHGRTMVMHQILSDRKFIAWGLIPEKPKERRWNYPL